MDLLVQDEVPARILKAADRPPVIPEPDRLRQAEEDEEEDLVRQHWHQGPRGAPREDREALQGGPGADRREAREVREERGVALDPPELPLPLLPRPPHEEPAAFEVGHALGVALALHLVRRDPLATVRQGDVRDDPDLLVEAGAGAHPAHGAGEHGDGGLQRGEEADEDAAVHHEANLWWRAPDHDDKLDDLCERGEQQARHEDANGGADGGPRVQSDTVVAPADQVVEGHDEGSRPEEHAGDAHVDGAEAHLLLLLREPAEDVEHADLARHHVVDLRHGGHAVGHVRVQRRGRAAGALERLRAPALGRGHGHLHVEVAAGQGHVHPVVRDHGVVAGPHNARTDGLLQPHLHTVGFREQVVAQVRHWHQDLQLLVADKVCRWQVRIVHQVDGHKQLLLRVLRRLHRLPLLLCQQRSPLLSRRPQLLLRWHHVDVVVS
mmetsp:Transcript_4804/g.14604  ORF Transcript_4804/g.14604 Transcript_4804/m.14604 type:complete len:437 (+) Transcript_4804:153-1463(+)